MASSTKRERELARRRAERQAQRRAEAEARRRRRRTTLLKAVAALAVLAVAVTLVALNYDFDAKDAGDPAAEAACTYNPEGTASKKVDGLPPSEPVQAAGTQKATLTTNRGPITLELQNSKAPCTVNSFTFLAAQKFFDSTTCHRVTQGGLAVVQCGDPSATGTGGPGYKYADENLTGATYPKGTLAMANSGADTNGSQFFLVYADSTLDPAYTPFGTVTGGLDILEAVGKAGPTSASDPKPKQPLNITSVAIS